jgi:IS6 family transposase
VTVLLRCAGVCYRLRYRLSDIDVAERGVRLDTSTVFAWVREFAPPYEDAARSFRRAVGSTWSVAVYRAVDGRGQVVDVYVSDRRAAGDAAALFRQAIAAMGMVPGEVTTDGAAAYPPALAAVLPGALHEAGKVVQRRIERDHQHLKGRLRPMRDVKTLAGARVALTAHLLGS